MKWSIPAKTFLLGEYAALSGRSAILLTTTPCFELTLDTQSHLIQVHKDSPAGIWWRNQNKSNKGLLWHDPYHGCGGLGASSAQFLGSYLASCLLNHIQPKLSHLLESYDQVSWNNEGLKPSGYDVLAQSQSGCVFINKQRRQISCHDWPFSDLSFILLHTGMKLATHHHLKDSALPKPIDRLSSLVEHAMEAFNTTHSHQLIQAINAYHQVLHQYDLIAPHSLQLIKQLVHEHREILAIKGCGALGADVILMLIKKTDRLSMKKKLTRSNRFILATEEQLTPVKSTPLINDDAIIQSVCNILIK